MRAADNDPLRKHQRIKARTPLRAERRHRGPGHWHVRVRSKVVVCRACGANIPKWQDPQSCPECGSGN
jgi:rubrerythrin